uniref:DNA internalization-related competence protein ComEC/Rec2 n=1 Tax=Thaumasiovibrio occultus TaxID=1891184 RepID=UPI00131D11A1|nr:DNA internalization-related competence protein ComEC/Rec2 [Thaumasiovibrio occultus]
MLINVNKINGQAIPFWQTVKLRLYLPPNKDNFPAAGQRYQWQIKVSPVNGRVNQAGFDAERYAVSQGIHARARIIEQVLIDPTLSLRQRWFDKFLALTAELTSQRYLVALAFGERRGLTPDDWVGLQRSGLSHLMAISGLHVGLVFGLGWTLGKGLACRMANSRRGLCLPYLVSLMLAFGYVWLSGGAVSAVRALIMCLFGAWWLTKASRLTLPELWLATMATVCLVQPLAAFSSAFWLSFVAVGIVAVAVRFTQQMHWLARLGVIQLALTVWMLPLQLLYFQATSVWSPLNNLVAIPYFSVLIIPLLMFALVSLMLGAGTFSQGLLWLIDLLLAPILWLIEQPLPLVTVTFGGWWFGMVMLPLIYFRRCRIWALSLAVALWIFRTPPNPDSWQIDMLDVGQGLALSIREGHHALIYDTGPTWRRMSMVDQVLTPVLREQGIREADGVMISHADNDHAGGLEALLSTWQPDWVRTSGSDDGFLPCRRGEQWQWRGLEFTVLWPPMLVERPSNPHSCVVGVGRGETGILLTGDIDAVSEILMMRSNIFADWLNNYPQPYLLVPHHGSKTSSTNLLLTTVEPKAALVSASATNPWGLPASAILQRYADHNIPVWSTREHGQVSIQFDQYGARIVGQRTTTQAYWYRNLFVEARLSQ